jgi:peptidoglycan-associated lipoprotein
MKPFPCISRLSIGLVCLVACGGAPKPVAPSETATTTTSTSATTSVPDNTRKAAGTYLTVSGDIYRMCHLDVQSDLQAAPKFSFDQSLITAADARVLDKVSDCLTSGPLAGRHVMLTGRADPRGTEEYNLSLGARRAHGVASYMEQHGVRETQVNETSRGALDANGNDESAWASDRRVDIALSS